MTSPGYPLGYPPNMDCYYDVYIAGIPDTAVAFTFLDMGIAYTDGCLGDFISISDGQDLDEPQR